jgi:hypothetical protein
VGGEADGDIHGSQKEEDERREKVLSLLKHGQVLE